MPDANGMPTEPEVFEKLMFSWPNLSLGQLRGDIRSVLAAVISEFQSPPSRLVEGGGTGRQWLPSVETRAYDGSGFAELVIDDVLLPVMGLAAGTDTPAILNPLSVAFADGSAYSLDTAPLPALRTPQNPGEGYHCLTFAPGYSGAGNIYSGNIYSGFPRGQQNILVTATFGSAVTPDICEAIRCEATSRLLVQGLVPLTGVGEDVKLEDFEINTSSGISVWGKSSPIAVYHTLYLQCVSRYRRAPTREWSRLAARQRMS